MPGLFRLVDPVWLRSPRSRARLLVGAALVAVACGRAGPSPAATVVASPSAASSPSPTPPASVFVVEGVPLAVEEAAREWAGEAGVSVAIGSEEDLVAALARGGLAYVVSAGAAGWAEEAAFVEAGVKGVVTDPPATGPLPHLSVLGGEYVHWGEVGFLGGILTGYSGGEQAVGLVEGEAGDGMDEVRTGFEQGARYSCPRCRVVRLPAAGFDPAEFVRNGVEAVFVTPGSGAREAAERAGAGGLWVIGYAGSGDLTAERLAARIRPAPEALVGSALESLADGGEGQSWSYSVESGSLLLTDLRAEAISPGKQRLAQEAWALLRGGQLQLLEP